MFALPKLPYNYESLEPFVDGPTMHLHHEKHHAAYTKNFNDALTVHPELENFSAEELLMDLTKIPEDIRAKIKNNGGGYVNHSFFWKIMNPIPSSPSKPLSEAIISTFGTMEVFKEKFQSAAVGHFGSGWAWLVADKNNLKIIDTANQDSPLSMGLVPLLTVDVWEHAYYLKYQNRRAEYLEAWWNVINWLEVSENLSKI